MNVIKKLTIDLYRRGVPQRLELIRGDSAVSLEIALMCDGAPWEIPQNANVLLRYRNGQAGGEYDTLPNGTAAYSFTGSVLTVQLAPAVCSMVGDTDFQVVIYEGTDQKSTLRIPLFVQGEVSGSVEPESYTNLTQWLLQYGGSGGGTLLPDELNALQSQVGLLQANKADEVIPIEMEAPLVQDWFIRYEDGQQQAVSGERCTDFIPVTPGIGLLRGEKLLLQGRRALCFYDCDKNFLRCGKTGSADTIVELEVPANAAYFRTSVSPTESPVFSYVQIIKKQFTDVNARIDAGNAHMDATQASWIERIHPQTPPIDLTDKMIDGHFIRSSGTEGTQEGERCTDFVPVTGGYGVHFTGLCLVSARAVCVYDENKNFIKCLRSGTDQTDITLNIPAGAAYFRASIQPSGVPTANYTDILGTVEKRRIDREDALMTYIGTISPLSVSPDLSQYLIYDQFIRGDGTAGSQSGERCTDFVPVQGGYSLSFGNLLLQNNRAFVAYDENKEKIATLLTQSNQTDVTLTMPENAAYFRTSVQPDKVPHCSYLPLLHQVEERLCARLSALENLPVYNGEVEAV
ncbi:MAG: hypothetical protein IJD63_03390 [Oscillospiraceae bacterium]|nr:hypothetical protein [Oscillospiraceae bacterium]